MDVAVSTLRPAETLARDNPIRFPGESADYRAARTALLAEEIELRRHIERVAAQRRALPAGPPVTAPYRFEGSEGRTDLAGLFGDKQTLAIYSFMFGPERERPCPMCTNLLSLWDGNAVDLDQRMSLVIVARSPIDRLLAWKNERGWKALRIYSDLDGAYSRDFHAIAPDGSDLPAYSVFTRRDGIIRLFYAEEMTDPTADPGQDPRGAPDPGGMWSLLDTTPEGRGGDWYPKLAYPE